MGSVESYVKLAERPNTTLSYASAVRHFEVEGRGSLPATSDAIAAYLAQYAETLSISTLRTRLAGLSSWHRDHGFRDPTKSELVSQVLKGIRAAHNTPQKQARPVDFELLIQVSEWLSSEIDALPTTDPKYARFARDNAMLLVGFWRGFRSDELTRLRFEHVTVNPGVSMNCFLPFSKGDRESMGRTFFCPSLSKVCPVTAFQQWQQAIGQTSGPVFRRIDQWGHISENGMAAGSIVPWLRSLFKVAGVPDPETYSSHSLRRGFANWAQSSGWELKELMDYVGWTNVNSALRYLEISENDLNGRFEAGLAAKSTSSPKRSRTESPKPAKSNVVSLRRRTPE